MILPAQRNHRGISNVDGTPVAVLGGANLVVEHRGQFASFLLHLRITLAESSLKSRFKGFQDLAQGLDSRFHIPQIDNVNLILYCWTYTNC